MPTKLVTSPGRRNPFRPSFILALPCLLAAIVPAQAQSDETADQTVKLQPFQVAADTDSNGYHVTSASTATRTNTALIDIPQTVDIVTSQFWRDTDATTFDESFKYVGNAYVRNRNAGAGDQINLRGFQTASSIAVDGVLVGTQSYKRDLTGYDRLEIVKGPPSAVQGRAGGTGFFNYILKKPELSGNFANFKYTTGTDQFSDSFNRLDFDGNYVVDQKHTLAVRVAGAWQRSDEYIKFTNSSIMALYPSVRWKPTNRTEVVWTTEALKDLTPSRDEGHGFADYPYTLRILFPQFKTPNDPITALHLPYNFSIIGPGANAYEKVLSSTLFVTQQIDDHISYRQVLNVRNNSLNTQSFTAENNSVTVIASGYTAQRTENDNITVQGDLIANYRWKFLNSSTLLGYNYRDSSTVSDTYAGVPAAPFNTINIVALAATGDSPSYFNGRTVNATRSVYTIVRPYNFGAYAEEDLGFFKDRLILNGSLRRDHDHTETDNKITNLQTAASNTQLTSYRFGLTVKLTHQLAAYAVESLQNDPASTINKYNGLLAGDPRLNEYLTVSPSTKLYEYGLKGELFGGRMSFAADHWEITRTGSTVNLLANGVSQGQNVSFGTQTVLQGASSHGFEFSTYGDITDRFSVIFNYTRMMTGQQNSADPAHPGNRVPLQYAPIWNYNFFGKYVVWKAPTMDAYLKAGLSGIGPFTAQATLSTGATLIYIPQSQKNIDAGGGFHWRNYNVDMMVTNIANDPYLVTRDQPPRTFRFSFSAHY
jgi:outer membrane receptor protein involved in Fe transport